MKVVNEFYYSQKNFKRMVLIMSKDLSAKEMANRINTLLKRSVEKNKKTK